MPILTPDMKRVVEEQRLGFIASVNSDGTPNLSPRGSLAVWDDDQLVFADIASPGTTANLRARPAVAVNVVDPIRRRGYRFHGQARIVDTGAELDAAIEFYRRRGLSQYAIQAAVFVILTHAAEVRSPIYDTGVDEAEVLRIYLARFRETFSGF